jgi:hypothetical protein
MVSTGKLCFLGSDVIRSKQSENLLCRLCTEGIDMVSIEAETAVWYGYLVIAMHNAASLHRCDVNESHRKSIVSSWSHYFRAFDSHSRALVLAGSQLDVEKVSTLRCGFRVSIRAGKDWIETISTASPRQGSSSCTLHSNFESRIGAPSSCNSANKIKSVLSCPVRSL